MRVDLGVIVMKKWPLTPRDPVLGPFQWMYFRIITTISIKEELVIYMLLSYKNIPNVYILNFERCLIFHQQPPKWPPIWRSPQVRVVDLNCLVSEARLPRQYLLYNAEFMAWRLRHINWRMSMVSSICDGRTWVSIHIWLPTIKWPCIESFQVGGWINITLFSINCITPDIFMVNLSF